MNDRVFAALADPTRRTVFEKLAARPQTVGALASQLPVSRPAVSQHLAVLTRARLVRHRKEGTRHVYRPDPAGLAPLRAYVERLWDDVLAAFAASEEEHGGVPHDRDDA